MDPRPAAPAASTRAQYRAATATHTARMPTEGSFARAKAWLPLAAFALLSFLPFGVAVTLALSASLGVALTIVPVLAFFLLRKVTPRVNPEGELPETIWQRLYTPVLRTAPQGR